MTGRSADVDSGGEANDDGEHAVALVAADEKQHGPDGTSGGYKNPGEAGQRHGAIVASVPDAHVLADDGAW